MAQHRRLEIDTETGQISHAHNMCDRWCIRRSEWQVNGSLSTSFQSRCNVFILDCNVCGSKIDRSADCGPNRQLDVHPETDGGSLNVICRLRRGSRSRWQPQHSLWTNRLAYFSIETYHVNTPCRRKNLSSVCWTFFYSIACQQRTAYNKPSVVPRRFNEHANDRIRTNEGKKCTHKQTHTHISDVPQNQSRKRTRSYAIVFRRSEHAHAAAKRYDKTLPASQPDSSLLSSSSSVKARSSYRTRR